MQVNRLMAIAATPRACPIADPAGNTALADFAWNALPRGLALFLGDFSLLNLAGCLRATHFDATSWWVRVPFLPPTLAKLFLFAAALSLLGFSVRTPRAIW